MLPTEPTISQSNFYNTLARLWKGKIYARRHRQACRPAVLRQSCRAAAQRWSEERREGSATRAWRREREKERIK